MNYTHWLETPLHVRAQIAKEFNISKIRSTHVANNIVVDDGYNIKDIEGVISVDNLQTHLNSKETDLVKLFSLLVDKINGVVPVLDTLPQEEADQFKEEFKERQTNKKNNVKKTK